MKYLISIVAFSCVFNLIGQDLPKDFLSSEFHKERRELLREKLPENSVAVFFANPVRNRANDVDFMYHQDPNFYYLTGYMEPHAVLLIFKEEQTSETANHDEILFVQPRNPTAELWTGRRLGDKGAQEKLNFLNAFNNSEFNSYNIDFTKFDKILFYEFFEDVRNTDDESDLYNLILQFKQKVSYPGTEGLSLNIEPEKNNLDNRSLDPIMDQLRGIKTLEELKLIRKAVDISNIGQNCTVCP